QPRAAPDVERGPAVERPADMLIALPMLVDHVADVFEPYGIELVQHRLGSVRVPPIARMGGELRDLFGDDARFWSCHRRLLCRERLQNERELCVGLPWTIFSSGAASSIARTCRWRKSPPTSARPPTSIRRRPSAAMRRRCARRWSRF